MIDRITIDTDAFFLELFQEMRSAGLLLTPEHLQLLRLATSKGIGLGKWDDLEETCQLLWVKPSPNYDKKLFTEAFKRFRQKHEPVPPEVVLPDPAPESLRLNVLPKIPARKRPTPEREPDHPEQTPTAVKLNSGDAARSSGSAKRSFVPTHFPVDLRDVRGFWALLRQWVKLGQEQELDVDATLAKIQQEGIFSDVVFRSVEVRRAELLLLIDDSSVMIPFLPAIKPLLNAVTEHWITPAQIYRFTALPGEYLYPWDRPTKGERISNNSSDKKVSTKKLPGC